jgi:hypothetical protein
MPGTSQMVNEMAKNLSAAILYSTPKRSVRKGETGSLVFFGKNA